MRYNLLSGAIIGAATVHGLAIDKRDYTNDGVCKVETVTVKLTSLDHFVGHTFDLLTPEKAVAGVLEALNASKGDTNPNGAPLVPSIAAETYDPKKDFKTVPLAAEGTFSGFASGTGGAGSGSAQQTGSGDSPFPTDISGIIPSGVLPSGVAGAGSKVGGAPAPTGKPSFPNLPGLGGGDDVFSSIASQISSALGQLTKSSTKTFQGGSSETDSSADAGATGSGVTGTGSIISTNGPSASTAPFPIPSGSGSNSTIATGTGSASADVTTTPLGTSAGASSSSVASSSGRASSSGTGASASSTHASSSGSKTSAASSTLATSSGSKTSASASKTSASSSSASASATGKCSNPEVRPEWRDMSDSNKKAYAEAVKCLMKKPASGKVTGATTRWEDLAGLHQLQNAKIHGVGQFLPWHRYFLHVHATLLKTECSYNGPIPWWDETKDAGQFDQSPVFDSNYLGSARQKTGDGLGACVTDGVFANQEINIGPGNSNSEHCLSRAVDNSLSQYVTNNFIASCNTHTKYADMLKCAYEGPHAYGHDAVGAVMSDVASSPSDPIFFLHHGMVDRAWKMWQSQSKENLNAMGGYTTSGGSTLTTTSYKISSLGVLDDVEIAKVMDTEGDYLCYEYSY